MSDLSIIQMVGDHAVQQAEEFEAEASDMEGRAEQKRQLAQVLRRLYAVASPWAKPSILEEK